ncbi:MAG: hypothetical protein BWZ10_02474 [candidate division BRC1 bacterium ADurb.BinA364]|nr:MAG: hypothetical protein BWZ10_02474 [candidate division BRC1 bacterium ADurb.BinA364]
MMLAQRQIDPHELAMREERFRLYESILPAALDKTEAFLLAEEWQPPVFHNFPGEANCDRFTQLAALAVARASLHDEQEKAEMLLERLLRVLAIVHIGRFPLAEWAYSHYLPPLFFWLGEERRISPEGWLKALQALDAALLPKERIGEMRAAHALRARDAAMKALEGRPVAMEPRWLCDALGGSIGQGIFAALRPLARSRAEALSLAYAKGENTKATANGVALGLLVDGPFYLQFADSGWQRHAGAQIESNSGLKREQGLELARLTAAAQLYRAQSGAEPRSLEDLTGMGFVAPADSQSPFPQVFWLDSNDPSLAAGGKKEFRARPVFCVHARWGPLPFDFDRNGEWIISLACWPGDLSIDGKGAKWLAEAPRPGAD